MNRRSLLAALAALPFIGKARAAEAVPASGEEVIVTDYYPDSTELNMATAHRERVVEYWDGNYRPVALSIDSDGRTLYDNVWLTAPPPGVPYPDLSYYLGEECPPTIYEERIALSMMEAVDPVALWARYAPIRRTVNGDEWCRVNDLGDLELVV